MKVQLSNEERRKRFWQARRGWGYSKDMTRTDFLRMRDEAYAKQKKKEEEAGRKQAAAARSKASSAVPGMKKRGGKLKWVVIILLLLGAAYYYLKYIRKINLPF